VAASPASTALRADYGIALLIKVVDLWWVGCPKFAGCPEVTFGHSLATFNF